MLKEWLVKSTLFILFVTLTVTVLIAYDNSRSKAAARSALVRLRLENASLSKELEKIKSYSEQITQLNAELKIVQARLGEPSKPAETEQLQEAEDKLAALSQANEFLDKQMENLNSYKNSLQEELSRTRAELDMVKKETLTAVSRDEALQAELSNVRSTLISREQELKQKTQDLNNADVLRDTLKNQLLEVSNLLAQKELELAGNRKELSGIKEELASLAQEKETVESRLRQTEGAFADLKMKYDILEAELTLVRQQHNRIADEMSKAVSLNADLQESLTGIPHPALLEEVPAGRKSRGKVDVYLTPIGGAQ
ncbi:MAG: hypothetical protein PHI60_03440 [Candidatus Omnitrophica bacterium]|nr:hypothetical protein [Candidatus Omnitrophota bacterium]